MLATPPPDLERIIQKLRRVLPVRASVRAELVAASRTHFAVKGRALHCNVMQVYYADERRGLMCQVAFDCDAPNPTLFVLPIAHVSFERAHPIAREVAIYRRRRREDWATRRKAKSAEDAGFGALV